MASSTDGRVRNAGRADRRGARYDHMSIATGCTRELELPIQLDHLMRTESVSLAHDHEAKRDARGPEEFGLPRAAIRVCGPLTIRTKNPRRRLETSSTVSGRPVRSNR